MDEQLLALEIDTIHGLAPGPSGGVRRLRNRDAHAVFGWSPVAAVLAVTEQLAEVALLHPGRQAFVPDVVPDLIKDLVAVIEKTTKVAISGGPSFLFPGELAAPTDGQDIKSASAGPDAIVYEELGSIHLFDPATGKTSRVEIRVAGDFPAARPHFEPVAKRVVRADISPTGARAVFEAHGEILTVPAGGRRRERRYPSSSVKARPVGASRRCPSTSSP